jgi:nitrogen regulatory protein PII
MVMQVLVLILNKVDCLEDILEGFIDVGIKGATVIDSMGMARVLGEDKLNNIPIFASMRMIINESYPYNKTIFVVFKDEQVLLAIDVIKRKVGDLNKPGVGILFTIPVNYVEGIAE